MQSVKRKTQSAKAKSWMTADGMNAMNANLNQPQQQPLPLPLIVKLLRSFIMQDSVSTTHSYTDIYLVQSRHNDMGSKFWLFAANCRLSPSLSFVLTRMSSQQHVNPNIPCHLLLCSGIYLALSLVRCTQLQLFGKAPTPASSSTSSLSPALSGRQTLDTWQQTEWWKLSQRWWRRRRRPSSRSSTFG